MGSGYIASPSTSTPPPGPVLPDPLPGLGVANWDHYWHANRIDSAVGKSVATWPDAAPSAADPLTRVAIGTNTVEPVLMEENGLRFVRFAGVDLRSTLPLSAPHSGVLLVRTPVIGQTVIRYAGCALDRNSANNGRYRATWGSNAAGGTVRQVNGATFGYATDGWALVQHSAVPAAPSFKVNGEATSVATGNYDWGGASSGLRLIQHPLDPAADGTVGATEYVDVALHATLPFYLADTDMAAIYAAVKAAHPGANLP